METIKSYWRVILFVVIVAALLPFRDQIIIVLRHAQRSLTSGGQPTASSRPDTPNNDRPISSHVEEVNAAADIGAGVGRGGSTSGAASGSKTRGAVDRARKRNDLP